MSEFSFFRELDRKLSGLAKTLHILSADNTAGLPDTSWNETAKDQYTRFRNRLETDLSEKELIDEQTAPPAGGYFWMHIDIVRGSAEPNSHVVRT